MIWSGLVGLGAAFILGALHALEPGHGKTVVGAYLVGSRGRPIDAIVLGLIVTLAHTAGVLALGILAVGASAYFVPQVIDRVLSVVAGGLVLAVGLWLVSAPLRRRVGRPALASAAGFADDLGFETAAAAEPAPAWRRARFIGHQHHDHDHSHQHHHHSPLQSPGPTGDVAGPPGLSTLVTLGLSGGIIPCPAALAVLLASIAADNLVDGVARVLAFSGGLAVVLIAIGLALVGAGQAVFRRLPLDGQLPLLRSVSGFVIFGLGGYLTVQALRPFFVA